jgi:hypothetical protein
LLANATPVAGSYTPASATFELQGTPTGGDYIELAWDEEHYTYQLYGDRHAGVGRGGSGQQHQYVSQTMQASANGAAITLTLIAAHGSNGNRIGVYGNV